MVSDSELPWTLEYKRGGTSRSWIFYLELLSLLESARGLCTSLSHSCPFSSLESASDNIIVRPQKVIITHSSLNPKEGLSNPWYFPKLSKKEKQGDGTGKGNSWWILPCSSLSFTGTSSARPVVLQGMSLDPLGNPKTLWRSASSKLFS